VTNYSPRRTALPGTCPACRRQKDPGGARSECYHPAALTPGWGQIKEEQWGHLRVLRPGPAGPRALVRRGASPHQGYDIQRRHFYQPDRQRARQPGHHPRRRHRGHQKTPATCTSPKAGAITRPPPRPSTCTALISQKWDIHGTRRSPATRRRWRTRHRALRCGGVARWDADPARVRTWLKAYFYQGLSLGFSECDAGHGGRTAHLLQVDRRPGICRQWRRY